MLNQLKTEHSRTRDCQLIKEQKLYFVAHITVPSAKNNFSYVEILATRNQKCGLTEWNITEDKMSKMKLH